MKKIDVFGSTGSIGTQALSVIRELGFEVSSLAAHSNVKLLEEQIRCFKPKNAVVFDEVAARDLKVRVSDMPVRVSMGMDGLCEVADSSGADVFLNALSGYVGLLPTLSAIGAHKDIALANKETLVAAGELVTSSAREAGVRLLPVDSEHSAIFQCLQGYENPVSCIYLTASGGPFRGMTKQDMENVTLEQALNHPNWSMGKKITIDSASMMNKGLEVIEARWLFDLPADKIKVVVHPQSVIHSMVEYTDGAVIAQLGTPDMRLPISYALTYPKRVYDGQKINFFELSSLTFEEPDVESFPCLALAYRALELGGYYPAVMNAANELAVSLFLNGKIGFLDIPLLIEKSMRAYNVKDVKKIVLDEIIDTERFVREAFLSFGLELE